MRHTLRYWWHHFHQQKSEAGGLYPLLTQSALALTFTSGLSYALGLVRDRAFAVTFGAGAELDVYNATFVIPDLFLALFVTGALSAAFVPIFSQLDEESPELAVQYTNKMLSYMLSILIVAGILFAISLPWLAPHIVPGFTESQLEQYILMTRLMLISPLLFALSNTFGNMLISIKAFLWYGLAPVMYNIGIIIGVFLFVPALGIPGLVLGTILGAALHLLIRLPSTIKYGFRPRLDFSVDEQLKETLRLMLPKILQIGMWQVLLWWFIRLASQLPEGSVTMYSFARNFQSVPVSLIGIALALSAFSDLSHFAAHSNKDAFQKLLKKQSWRILFLTGLSALALAVLSYWVIDFLLGGGRFTQEAVLMTSSILAVYCLSVPLESLMHLYARAHYALKNTLRPSAIHILSILCIIAISAWLMKDYGLYAIPISFSIGLLLQISLLFASLRQLLMRS